MKKLLFLLFLFLPVAAFSQRFSGGITMGLSASQIDGDRYAGYNKAGFIGGMFARTDLTDKTGWQIEIKYIGKGAGKKNDPENPGYYKVKLHYIEVPLILYYNFTGKWSGEGGIAPGYLMKAAEDLDGGGFTSPEKPFRDAELDGLAGINYNFTDHLRANIRFSYSIIPVRNHPGDQVHFLDRGQYSNVLEFSVYYSL
ncbi:MAG TPA: porin family protein [Bacteroidales bacterium]|nr:porin family protein [Bacteroidales bacterium]